MPTELVTVAPQRALAIFAHPDDADVSCGGTIARWSDAGTAIEVVVCATGDKGSMDAAVNPVELVAVRSNEIDAAAALLGIGKVHRLGRQDGEFENDLSLRADLVEIIREFRPEVLICPDPSAVFFGDHYYNHRDHRVVGFAALDAAAPAAALPLYFPDSGEPWAIGTAFLAGSLESNIVVDVSATIDRKVEAVCCHESQLAGAGDAMREALRERAVDAGRSHRIGFGEAFRRIRLTP